MVAINSSHVIGDNLWLWRADHTVSGLVKNGDNPCESGLIVHGDDVAMCGLPPPQPPLACTHNACMRMLVARMLSRRILSC